LTRKNLEKYRQGDFFKASRDEIIDIPDSSITAIIEGRGWYPEDESPGDLFVKRFLGPSFVANLEKWMRS
jgi:hypothetical protein